MKFERISLIFRKIGDFFRNFFKKIKSLFDKEDKKALFEFVKDLFSGFSINLFLLVVFNFPLTWYSFIGLALGWRFIKKELLPLRRLWSNK